MGILELNKKVKSMAERVADKDQKEVNKNISKAKTRAGKQLDEKQKENEKAMAKKEKARK